jgi:DEAD/DEAH box helicase domain-containing protein
LAHDQLEKISDILANENIIFGAYDGDTPFSERNFLKKRARILLTNPDLLHLGILPYHTNWDKFFSRLSFVVIDEAHYYRGVLGSHMSEIMRRLRRISHYYGNFPQFILSSATLQNPEEFAFKLIGERAQRIGFSTAIPFKKYFIFFDPLRIASKTNLKRSSYKEAVWIMEELLKNNLRTIVFARSRRGVEMMTKDLLSKINSADRNLVSSYRAGYLKELRNDIEEKLRSGEIKTIITTNALELGIDIGDLDATIIIGYPGTISSVFQESGRSGRNDASITIFIAGANPLDQYFIKDPDYLFRKSFESIAINPDNPYILTPHIKCASYEMPINDTIDSEYFGGSLNDSLRTLLRQGVLEQRGHKFYYALRDYPASKVNIRGSSGQDIILINKETNEVLEIISMRRAVEEVFEGAIYFHLADPYFVSELNLQSKYALLSKTNLNYYTDSLAIHRIDVKGISKKEKFHRLNMYFGDVLVSETTIGFMKKQYGTDKKTGEEELKLPEMTFNTKAFWFTLNLSLEKLIKEREEEILGTIHAVEHLLVAMMPIVVICDRNDVGGVSHPLHPDTGKPTIFVYDGAEGGVGLAEKGFERAEELFTAACKAVSTCSCKTGCPSCIFSPKCGNRNNPLSKRGAIALLKEILK